MILFFAITTFSRRRHADRLMPRDAAISRHATALFRCHAASAAAFDAITPSCRCHISLRPRHDAQRGAPREMARRYAMRGARRARYARRRERDS
jgi:hypothetical protein